MAALASPAPKPTASGDRSSPQGWKNAPAWDDDGLEDDIATLSYERALRTHARYRAADPDDRSLTQAAPPVDSYETLPAEAFAAAPKASPNAPYQASAAPEPTAVPRAPVLFEKNLKSASITIRVSKEECEQLHQRAAEAGLTVSAYLRSCTFEAESLRALVKDTMAQLKPATAVKKQTTVAGERRSWFGWMARLLMPRPSSRRVARA